MATCMIDLTSFYLQSGIFCVIVDALIKLEIYSDYVQVCKSLLQSSCMFVMVNTFKDLEIFWNNLRDRELQAHLAPSGYLKIPTVSIVVPFGYISDNEECTFCCLVDMLLYCWTYGR